MKKKQNAEDKLQEIETLLKTAQERVSSMQSSYESFLEIRKRIEDEDSWLETIFQQVIEKNKQSKELYKEIQWYRDESQQFLQAIKKHETESNQLKNDINQVLSDTKQEAQTNISEIKEITALVTETGFANQFHSKSKELKKSRNNWMWVLILGTIVLAILVVWLFFDTIFFDTLGDDGGSDSLTPWWVLYRISLTSPLWFLIWFAAKQYSKDNLIKWKYDFKATTASSISHHIKFLQERFEKDKEWSILSFSKDTFVNLYKEPYDSVENKELKQIEEKIEKLNKNNNMSEIDLEKIIKSTKELKNLFEDETMLKDILNIFKKLTLPKR